MIVQTRTLYGTFTEAQKNDLVRILNGLPLEYTFKCVNGKIVSTNENVDVTSEFNSWESRNLYEYEILNAKVFFALFKTASMMYPEVVSYQSVETLDVDCYENDFPISLEKYFKNVIECINVALKL